MCNVEKGPYVAGWKTKKGPTALWMGFLNNDESKSCLSYMWNIYWSSSSSLPNMKTIHWRIKVFVCVEVLRLSQPSGVMSSEVSLPNHTFTGQD